MPSVRRSFVGFFSHDSPDSDAWACCTSLLICHSLSISALNGRVSAKNVLPCIMASASNGGTPACRYSANRSAVSLVGSGRGRCCGAITFWSLPRFSDASCLARDSAVNRLPVALTCTIRWPVWRSRSRFRSELTGRGSCTEARPFGPIFWVLGQLNLRGGMHTLHAQPVGAVAVVGQRTECVIARAQCQLTFSAATRLAQRHARPHLLTATTGNEHSDTGRESLDQLYHARSLPNLPGDKKISCLTVQSAALACVTSVGTESRAHARQRQRAPVLYRVP